MGPPSNSLIIRHELSQWAGEHGFKCSLISNKWAGTRSIKKASISGRAVPYVLVLASLQPSGGGAQCFKQTPIDIEVLTKPQYQLKVSQS